MTKDLEYYQYIVEHKDNIKKAFEIFGKSLCNKANVPESEVKKLIDKHDFSKFSSKEFVGYRQWFYPDSNEVPNPKLFEEAWEHHYKNNAHHPEHWISEDGEPLSMPDIYVIEMVLDWCAMSLKFHTYPIDYYENNKDEILIHPTSRNLTESLLEVIGHHEIFNTK